MVVGRLAPHNKLHTQRFSYFFDHRGLLFKPWMGCFHDACDIAAMSRCANSPLTAPATIRQPPPQNISIPVASTLLGKFPTKEVAVAIGNVAQQYVDNATGRAPMLRENRAAMLRGNADVARGAYEDAIRDFRLAYLLVNNGAKHE